MVYYKVRKYQGYGGQADPFLESRWWALIEYYSKKKKENLKKILDDPEYRTAFDIQLEIPALGDGMELGVIHKMFTMGCDEVCFVTHPFEAKHYLTNGSWPKIISRVSGMPGKKRFVKGNGSGCKELTRRQ